LLTDPSSHLTAAVLGWDFPVSREWIVLADQWDVFVQANTKKGRATTYSRPVKSKRRGRTALSPADARAALDRNAGRG
jgi:hypothetical protein